MPLDDPTIPPASRHDPGSDPSSDPSLDALSREVGAAAADPDRRFGRYVFLGEVGRGGMGAVHRAWDPALERVVAIKVLTRAASDKTLERFRREARAAAALRHPGIVRVYEVGEEGGQPFLVMDHVEGRTLKEHLKTGLPRDDAVAAIRAVARALGHAHAHGIVHRDVKPGNVLMGPDGPLLVDFGLARDPASDDARLTATGEVIGTVSYMAPEQVRGRPGEIGPPTDVWALGAVLYEALLGRPPYVGDAAVSVMAAIIAAQPPPRPRALDASIAPALEAVVLRCLARAPADRFASGGEVDRALADAAAEPAPAASVASHPRTVSSGRLRPARPSARRKAAAASSGRVPAAGASTRIPKTSASPAPIVAALALAAVVVVVGFVAGGRDADPDAPELVPATDAGAASGATLALETPVEGAVVGADGLTVAGRVTAGELDSIWIDGRVEVELGPDGRFEHRLPLDEGDHTIRIASAPGAPPLVTRRVVVDRTPPAVALTAPAPGAIIAPGSIAVAGTADDPHVQGVRLTCSVLAAPVDVDVDAGAFAATLDVTSAPSGPLEIIATARDAAGNEASTSTHLVVDADPPAIVVDAVAPGADGRLVIRGHIDDAHPRAMRVAGADRPVDAEGRFEVVVDAESGPTVLLEATDAAGIAAAPVTVPVEVDRDPPVLAIGSPADGGVTAAASVEVRGSVRDASPSVAVRCNGIDARVEPADPADASGARAFTATVPLVDGDNDLEVIATDPAGNETVARARIARDVVAPTPTLAAELPDELWGRDRIVTVAGRVDELGCAVTVGGQLASVDAEGRFEGRVRLEPGENRIVVTARDRAGNEGHLERSVVYHRRKPKVRIVPEDTWWRPTARQLAFAKAKKLPLWIENDLGMRFVLIPPGRFLMGSPLGEPSRRDDETQHEVTLTRGFYIGATEVTNAPWRRFSQEPREKDYSGHPIGADDQPAGELSWDEARQFCAWLSEGGDRYRLPTEAEWEWAARGETTTAFWWGRKAADFPPFENVMDPTAKKDLGIKHGPAGPGDDGFVVTAPAGSLRPNPYGLHDVLGNVREWCADVYAPYAAASAVDPTGPSDGDEVVFRGGSFLADAQDCRVTHRWHAIRKANSAKTGVRVVLELPGQD